jgi:hypothetical protein
MHLIAATKRKNQESTYLPCTEVAKLIRKILKEEFVGVKFSVNSDKYSGGSSINVSWIDGPTSKAVESVVDKYAGAKFDSYEDRKVYRPAIEIDGELYKCGVDYIFTNRKYSASFYTRVAEELTKEQGLRMPSITESWNGGAMIVDNDSQRAVIDGREDTLADCIYRAVSKIDARNYNPKQIEAEINQDKTIALASIEQRVEAASTGEVESSTQSEPKRCKAISIELRRAEGHSDDCISVLLKVGSHGQGQLWKMANAVLRSWSESAPSTGGYDKCDFTIRFEDKVEYKGRYDLYHYSKETPDLVKHVYEDVAFQGGLFCPEHMSRDVYESVLEDIGEETQKACIEFLETYEIPIGKE